MKTIPTSPASGFAIASSKGWAINLTHRIPVVSAARRVVDRMLNVERWCVDRVERSVENGHRFANGLPGCAVSCSGEPRSGPVHQAGMGRGNFRRTINVNPRKQGVDKHKWTNGWT
jgi:hypothetical protein